MAAAIATSARVLYVTHSRPPTLEALETALSRRSSISSDLGDIAFLGISVFPGPHAENVASSL